MIILTLLALLFFSVLSFSKGLLILSLLEYVEILDSEDCGTLLLKKRSI